MNEMLKCLGALPIAVFSTVVIAYIIMSAITVAENIEDFKSIGKYCIKMWLMIPGAIVGYVALLFLVIYPLYKLIRCLVCRNC